MNTRTTIQNELNTLGSPLPADGHHTPFSLPEGYFEGLANAIMGRIKASERPASEEIAYLSPLLAGISRTMPFRVPDAYFSENLEALPAVIGEEPASSLLAQAGKGLPFELPAGYFEGLDKKVLDRVEEQRQPARVVPLRRWTKWVAAAAIAGVVTLSGIAYLGGNGKKEVSVNNPQWLATELRNVSKQDIDEFVHAADATATSPVKASQANGEPAEVKKLLKGVSTQEVDEFLSQLPTEDEELGIN